MSGEVDPIRVTVFPIDACFHCFQFAKQRRPDNPREFYSRSGGGSDRYGGGGDRYGEDRGRSSRHDDRRYDYRRDDRPRRRSRSRSPDRRDRDRSSAGRDRIRSRSPRRNSASPPRRD